MNRPADEFDGLILDSHEYAAWMRTALDDQVDPSRLKSDVHLDYHHPLEDYLTRPLVLRLLKWLTRDRGRGKKTVLEEIFASYRNPAAPAWQRIKYRPIHLFIDRMRGGVSVAEFKRRVSEHRPVVRGMVLAARSVLKNGLTTPQRFAHPLFAVWNFTNRCNLKCRHCYQSAGKGLTNELTLDEKLTIIEQLADSYLPMIAFAGGEPLISPDLWPVLERCQANDIHVSIATNGTLITPENAQRLAELGVRYVEVSLDAVDPKRHDGFRGIDGAWQRTVQGMKTVVATEGLRLGVAMCIHRGNYDLVRETIEFAIDIGAACFAYFNFIPVGRGRNMIEQDITPAERERLLILLNEYIQGGRIGVISTCPQFGRVCLAHSSVYGGRVAATHCGSGSGVKARVIAKYLGGCGAGRTYACIEPDGTVTPCVYMPDYKIGSLRENTLQQIVDRSDLWDLLNDRDQRSGHCGRCAFRYYCGGCRARAAAYFHDPAGPDPGCIFNTDAWNELTAAAVSEALEFPQQATTSAG